MKIKSAHRYNIIESEQLIIEYYYGDISFADLKKYKETLYNDKDYNPYFNLIADFRDTKLSLSHEDINEIIKYTETNMFFYKQRLAAYITNTPTQVISWMQVKENLKKGFPVKIKVCSTLSTVIEWIGAELRKETYISDRLKELKESC